MCELVCRCLRGNFVKISLDLCPCFDHNLAYRLPNWMILIGDEIYDP